MDLLLLADPFEDSIYAYLDIGDCYVALTGAGDWYVAVRLGLV